MTEPATVHRTAAILRSFLKELLEAQISGDVADALVLHAGKSLIDNDGLVVGK